MNISLIAATSLNRMIGHNNKMPWHLPADLAWFKANTINKPVIMGRKTFESIGRALPNRVNIVLSSQVIADDNVKSVTTIEQALELVKDQPEIMIIGGGEIFEQTLPLANKIYLTEIQTNLAGDTKFPKLDSSWQLVSSEMREIDSENKYRLKFMILERSLK